MPIPRQVGYWIVLAILAGFGLSPAMDADVQEVSEVLFDGETLRGWTTLKGDPVLEGEGWEVVEGVIHLMPSKKSAGNIMTAHDWGDFDLSFEWKIAAGGNGGLKYRVRRYGKKTLGCEYQIIDDANYKKGVTAKSSAGALYDLYAPNQEKRLKPPGEFNSARIVVRDNQVQHWLNGRMIVSATIDSEEWRMRVANSKFAEFKDFALNPRGRLMLTDHGSEAWYRNFRFHPLQDKSPAPYLRSSASRQREKQHSP